MPTPQEEFWIGEFGRAYTARSRLDYRPRMPFWRHIISLTGAKSILEIGCNSGINLKAIRRIDPAIIAQGVDINAAALREAANDDLDVFPARAIEVGALWPNSYDLTLTSGVLIHISSDQLPKAMGSIAKASKRYVLAIEYADDKEVEVNYRGHAERLWRRPFGRIYEAMGLKMVATGEAPDAWDRCTFWLCEKA